jgi:3-dehydroquinate dehydratase-2
MTAHPMTKILVIQGANINWLGKRQPEIYGTTSAAEIDERIRRYAADKGFEVEISHTNHEGAAIDRLYEAHRQGVDAIVMNPGGFTYAGHAIRDCILGIAVPVVEVHITNHFQRDIRSVTAPAAQAVIMGPGPQAYFLGLDAALHLARGE